MAGRFNPMGFLYKKYWNTLCLQYLRESIAITGAGRTDAGVHGRMMVAHFDAELSLDCAQLVYKVNRLLPRDVSVSRIEPVDEDLHARFSATSRTYHYYVHTGKQPFTRQYFVCASLLIRL